MGRRGTGPRGYDAVMPSDARPIPRLAREGARNLVALGIAAVVSIVALLGYSAFTPLHFLPDTVALTSFVFWMHTRSDSWSSPR